MLHSHTECVDSVEHASDIAKQRKVKGREHSTIWTTGVSEAITRAFINGTECEITAMSVTRSGAACIRIGNVWVRDSLAYLCTPIQCVELASILEKYGMAGTPGGTADAMLRKLVGGANWHQSMPDSLYDELRKGVPSGFRYSRFGKLASSSASVAAKANAFCHYSEGETIRDGMVYEVDMVGAYRHAMATLKLPMPQFGYRETEGDIDSDGMSYASVTGDYAQITGGKNGVHNGWVDNTIARLARATGAGVVAHKTLTPKHSAPFAALFVSEIERMMSENPAFRLQLKLICNNAFGVMFRERNSTQIVRHGTVPNSLDGVLIEGRHYDLVQVSKTQSFLSNPVASSYIAASVTENLLRGIATVRSSGATLVASDTDSIVYCGQSPQEVGIDVSGKRGAYKIECGPCHSVLIPAQKQRVVFNADGSVAKCVLAGVHRECFKPLIEYGSASAVSTPSLAECARFGRRPDDKWRYDYTLTDDGVSVRINNLTEGSARHGKRTDRPRSDRYGKRE